MALPTSLPRCALTALGLVAALGCTRVALAARIACVGDSITYGYGLGNASVESYPAVLQSLLGSAHDVQNFGVSGATLLTNGDKPYSEEASYDASGSFDPDVVLVMLGTNDAKPQNWSKKSEFAADYAALIAHYRALGALVYVAAPPPVYEPGAFDIPSDVVAEEVVPLVHTVATDAGAPLVDVFAALSEKPEDFPDKVHPNAAGAAIIAQTMLAALEVNGYGGAGMTAGAGGGAGRGGRGAGGDSFGGAAVTAGRGGAGTTGGTAGTGASGGRVSAGGNGGAGGVATSGGGGATSGGNGATSGGGQGAGSGGQPSGNGGAPSIGGTGATTGGTGTTTGGTGATSGSAAVTAGTGASGGASPRLGDPEGQEHDPGCGCRVGTAERAPTRAFAVFALVGLAALRRRRASKPLPRESASVGEGPAARRREAPEPDEGGQPRRC